MTIERYLAATRTGLERLDDPQVTDWLSTVIPGDPVVMSVMAIKSDQRRCEYVFPKDADGHGHLILDHSLLGTLSDLQTLMTVSMSKESGPPLAWLLASATFRQQRAFSAYHLCIHVAEQYRTSLQRLGAQRSASIFDFVRDFITAHEVSHVAYRKDAPWMADIRLAAEASRGQLVDHIRTRLAAPKERPEHLVHHVGIPMEEVPDEMLNANFNAMLDVIDDNEALIEEASCDWSACLLLLSREAGRTFFSTEFPSDADTSHRRLLDTLLLSRRMTMLLNFRTAYAQVVENLWRSDKAYRSTRQQIESNARLNIVTNLSLPFAEGVLQHIRYRDGTGFGPEASAKDLSDAFAPSFAKETESYHHRVFALTELIEPFRDQSIFEADYKNTFGHAPKNDAATLKAADDIRERLRSLI